MNHQLSLPRLMRRGVDHISVVYQTISNAGNPASPGLELLVRGLKSRGLVEELYHFVPHLLVGRGQNQLLKRNPGLFLSRAGRCTHHMAMDGDEFFIPGEFLCMKDAVDKGNFDASFCLMEEGKVSFLLCFDLLYS
jgi:hypothetical protein